LGEVDLRYYYSSETFIVILVKLLFHTPSCRWPPPSSPRAEVVSFASLSVPLASIAFRRASARAAAILDESSGIRVGCSLDEGRGKRHDHLCRSV
jgi:hypothetical protein